MVRAMGAVATVLAVGLVDGEPMVPTPLDTPPSSWRPCGLGLAALCSILAESEFPAPADGTFPLVTQEVGEHRGIERGGTGR